MGNLSAHARMLVLCRDAHSRAKREVDRASIEQTLCGVSRGSIRRSIRSTRETSRRNEKKKNKKREKYEQPNGETAGALLSISDYPFSRGKFHKVFE